MFAFSLLDVFFVVFHSALILFNLFGWIWRKTRLWNLVTLLLTACSWTLLGIFYGWGYCPLTDWHFQVLRKLGHTGLPTSYTKYLLDRITGMDWNTGLVDTATLVSLVLALVVSLYLNIFSKKRSF